MKQTEWEDIVLILKTEKERWEESKERAHRSDSPAWTTECGGALTALRLLEERLTAWVGH
jgi:hypothetical protein